MDCIELIYYMSLLNSIKDKNFKKRYIIKDTTASVYQHLGKFLGYKDNESLKLTNIFTEDDTWYDTYTPFINKLTEAVKKEEIKQHFNRKTLKKILMTSKYNIGRKSAKTYFLEKLNKIEEEEEFKDVSQNFHKIFTELKKGEIENFYLYQIPVKNFNQKIKELKELDLEDSTINFRYFIMRKTEICIFFKHKWKEKSSRHILINYKKTEKEDLEKMKIANLPNSVHALDALYKRRIIRIISEFKVPIFGIHDAFAVPFNKIELLILCA